MKCPKCGNDLLDEAEELIIDVNSTEDVLCVWNGKTTLQRHIHFSCPKSKTPNFVFYTNEGEDS